jgi:hypothetical protein
MASDFCKRHSEVSDAILVSAQTNVVRGKAVFLLVNRANEKLAAEFNKLAGIETYVFPANQLFNPEYKKWLDLLASGTSLVSEKAGSSVLLQYNSSHLKGANKVKFYYALKGRGGSKGILEVTHSEFIGKGVVLSGDKGASELAVFFKKWGCKTEKKEVIVDV